MKITPNNLNSLKISKKAKKVDIVEFNLIHINTGAVAVVCEKSHFKFPGHKVQENQVFIKLGKTNCDSLKVNFFERENFEIILNEMFGSEYIVQPYYKV